MILSLPFLSYRTQTLHRVRRSINVAEVAILADITGESSANKKASTGYYQASHIDNAP